jgi:hypothetical protein
MYTTIIYVYVVFYNKIQDGIRILPFVIFLYHTLLNPSKIMENIRK